jgi:hypothetical protein
MAWLEPTAIVIVNEVRDTPTTGIPRLCDYEKPPPTVMETARNPGTDNSSRYHSALESLRRHRV